MTAIGASATPCQHETEVRIGIAEYTYRRDPQEAQGQRRACNRRWRLRFTGDPERALEADREIDRDDL